MLFICFRVQKRDSCDPGGVSDGSQLAIYQTSLSSALLPVTRVLSVCAMHPFFFK